MTYWLENYIRPICKFAGYIQYRDIVGEHIVPQIGTVPLTELPNGILQHFLNREAACGNRKIGGPPSAKSIKNIRDVLDVALKCAVQEGRLTANPVPATVIRKVQRKSIQPMSDALQAAPECYLHPRLEAIHRQIDCPRTAAGSVPCPPGQPCELPLFPRRLPAGLFAAAPFHTLEDRLYNLPQQSFSAFTFFRIYAP